MKKIICLVLIFLLVFASGCGKAPNKALSEQAVQACQKAIEVLDDLKSYDIDPEAAAEKLETYAASIDDEPVHSMLIKSHAALIKSMALDGMSSEDYKRVQEMRDELDNTLYG